jgi:hypothetical protein
MKTRSISYLLFGAALLLDPMAGCERVASYDYGAREMKAAVAGTWTVKTKTGREVTFEVDVGAAERHSSRGWIQSASACSHRSMVSTAEACIDSTEMKLKVIVASSDTPVEAKFAVHGMHFTRGQLSMTIGTEYVSAEVSPRGSVIESYNGEVVHAL